jgi:hypothetical protein
MKASARLTATVLLASIGLSAGAIALGYERGGDRRGATLALAVGLLWILSTRYDWGGMAASLGLVGLVGVAALGLLPGLGAGWMVCGVVAALSAWDLDRFARRLGQAGQVEKVRRLEAVHLRRLAVVDGVALLIATVALGIRVEIGFGMALLLGGLAILGLSQMVGALRRETGSED